MIVKLIGEDAYTKVNIAMALSEKHKYDVILVERDESFFIDGVKYEPIHRKENNPYNRHNMDIPLLINGDKSYTRKLDAHIDIIKEFGLINKKQSKLSKWERDEVINSFWKLYKKVL